MAVINELIRTEFDKTLSFGNYELDEKTKLSDYEFEGDLYKIKTYKSITKLEKNGMFVYESVPGSAVSNFKADDEIVSFTVEAPKDVQITLELEPEKEYKVFIDDTNVGRMKTNLGGKLILSVELEQNASAKVLVERI
ncbi:MAG: endosialidase [Lachnospiraceae bacterium]|nr:endosialidase [Lachnospiraceae bacterium]